MGTNCPHKRDLDEPRRDLDEGGRRYGLQEARRHEAEEVIKYLCRFMKTETPWSFPETAGFLFVGKVMGNFQISKIFVR